MNLLTETIESITKSGHTPDDITSIGSADGKYQCTWAEFTHLADVEYNPSFGGAEVATDLVIWFTDGTNMWRGEYDGSEWWQYQVPTPTSPTTPKPITRLVGHYWPNLADLHDEEDTFHRTGKSSI